MKTTIKKIGIKFELDAFNKRNLHKWHSGMKKAGAKMLEEFKKYGGRYTVIHYRYFMNRELTQFEKNLIEKLRKDGKSKRLAEFLSEIAFYGPLNNIKSKNIFILPYGGETFVEMSFLEHKYNVQSKCSPCDCFDHNTGITIAVQEVISDMVWEEIPDVEMEII